jgi:hypothetical protein
VEKVKYWPLGAGRFSYTSGDSYDTTLSSPGYYNDYWDGHPYWRFDDVWRPIQYCDGTLYAVTFDTPPVTGYSSGPTHSYSSAAPASGNFVGTERGGPSFGTLLADAALRTLETQAAWITTPEARMPSSPAKVKEKKGSGVFLT